MPAMLFSVDIPHHARVALTWAARVHKWLLDCDDVDRSTFSAYFIPTSIEEKEGGAFNVFLNGDRRTYIWVEPNNHEGPAFIVLHYVGARGGERAKNWSTDEQYQELRDLDPKPKE